MQTVKINKTKLSAQGKKIAIVVSCFNSVIVNNLLDSAQDTLYHYGACDADIKLVYVPGAFEIALIAKQLALSGKYQAIIALAAVIRGNTPHFEYVSLACTQGISQVALELNIPIIFGVLTTDTLEQAQARSGTDGNKGEEAAISAIEMINIMEKL